MVQECNTILGNVITSTRVFEDCEIWQKQSATKYGFYNDVYDGNVWCNFQNFDRKIIFSTALQLQSPTKCGLVPTLWVYNPLWRCIFLTVLNLPRTLWYLQENTLLLGVIPGSYEPKHHLNSSLKPFVDELLSLWSGVIFKTQDGCSQLVQTALLCATCNVLAARKVCDFVEHGAYWGCSRCLVTFSIWKTSRNQIIQILIEKAGSKEIGMIIVSGIRFI